MPLHTVILYLLQQQGAHVLALLLCKVRKIYCIIAKGKCGDANAASNQHYTDIAAASNVLACSAQFESFVATQQKTSVVMQMQLAINIAHAQLLLQMLLLPCVIANMQKATSLQMRKKRFCHSSKKHMCFLVAAAFGML